VLLDARATAHMGSGPSSSFELAVSAAASVGVHLAQEGLTGQLITHEGMRLGSGMAFEDMLLDSLAVIKPSKTRDLSDGIKEMRVSSAGVIIAVMGRLSEAEARQLAACRNEGSQAIALLLAVSTWADSRWNAQAAANGNGTGRPAGPAANGNGPASAAALADGAGPAQHGQPERPDETAPAAEVLRASGWHVVRIEAGTSLAASWQQLPRAAEMLVPAATLGGHAHADQGRPA
jgi:hypothetical protein